MFREILCYESGEALEEASQRGCGVSFPGDIKSPLDKIPGNALQGALPEKVLWFCDHDFQIANNFINLQLKVLLLFIYPCILRNQLTIKSLCNQHIESNPFILQKDGQFTYMCLVLFNTVMTLIVNFQILFGFISISVGEFHFY